MSAGALSGLKVALVHDWLTGMRGGEKVLESFCRFFPRAELYTLLHLPGSVSPLIEDRPIHTSFVQHLPLKATRYRYYLPLFPQAAESLKIAPCDLVLSTSHCVAKGVHPPQGALHVSYLHTPMRYVWEMYEQYFGKGRGGLARWVMPFVRPYLQHWDLASSDRVDHFLANSAHVAARIQRYYVREAKVIHPPVEVGRFSPAPRPDDYYLVLSALVPYKRVDLAVAACSQSGRRLKVVGKGSELERLKRRAGETVEFLGWRDDQAVAGLYARARALIFPGEEDFGITPVESMAAGRPVAAFAKGGALETVVGLDDPQGRPATGVFFAEQTPESLLAALDELETRQGEFDPAALAQHAAAFSEERFRGQIQDYLTELLLK